MLKIEGLKVNYGNIKALHGIDLKVEEGQIVTLIGSNGAGKSTTMNAISGIVKTAEGKILFEGKDIVGKSSDYIVKNGIVLAPEGRQIFPRMSVHENLMMGALTVKDKAKVAKTLEEVFDLFPILKEREKQVAGTLSGGEQQMLAVGRALMGSPRLLMLDEPSLGLAPLIIKEIFALIQRINKMGTTILLVEQNAKMALSISDYGYVLETGDITMEGKGSDLMNDPKVRAAYLGGM
ncbi:MAG: ABC transporter ATP-binding protein [Lachnospiraceae bacterium]|nr:ABC transporter ATP-binding protein [Lachnospiraceae bacterium]